MKHAQANRVSLTLDILNGSYTLRIEDDGLGFHLPDEAAEDSLGIRGMQERAAECQGSFTIISTPGCGTVTTISTELKNV